MTKPEVRSLMRFCYAESMIDPSLYVPLAKAAEESGYDSFMIPDGVCYPEHASTSYPYNADGTREFLDGKPFIEPLLLVAHLAAVTSRLKFITSVVKLPIRNPVHVAKQATSLAVLTNNRFVFGVGTSPWSEDYEVCSVPWERRYTRLDETVEILRALESGGFAEYHGQIYDVPSIRISPVPTERIPVVIGGHGELSLRRAARYGDGWTSAAADDELLSAAFDRLATLRKDAGRDHLPFDVYAGSARAFSVDGILALEELGVTELFIGFRDPYVVGPDTQRLDEKLAALRWYADEVIARVRS